MNSIEGYGAAQGLDLTNSSQSSRTLSADQKQQVQSILAKYDPKSITVQHAQDIFKQIMNAGIKPGKDLRDTIKAAGFDPHQLRSLASQSLAAGAPASQSAALTDDQKKQVQTILSKFDANNLTAASAQSIFKQLQQVQIQPGKDLKDTIKAAGFDMNHLASLAAPTSGHDPSQDGTGRLQGHSQAINMSALQSLQSILEQYDLKNLTDDQRKSLFTQLDQAGLLQSGDIINMGV